jgi:hypothetical protein
MSKTTTPAPATVLGATGTDSAASPDNLASGAAYVAPSAIPKQSAQSSVEEKLPEPSTGGSFVRLPDGALAHNPDVPKFEDKLHRRPQSDTTKPKA